jgi:hypothetical protein
MLTFPELHRESTLEMLPVVALSAVASGLLLPWSLLLGVIALVPGALWLLCSTWVGILNARLRYRWSRQYAQRRSWRQLRGLLKSEPDRYVVHLRYFGGFDVTPLCPAAVVEERGTGDLAAVYPASWRVPQVCEQLGVQLIPG